MYKGDSMALKIHDFDLKVKFKRNDRGSLDRIKMFLRQDVEKGLDGEPNGFIIYSQLNIRCSYGVN